MTEFFKDLIAGLPWLSCVVLVVVFIIGITHYFGADAILKVFWGFMVVFLTWMLGSITRQNKQLNDHYKDMKTNG